MSNQVIQAGLVALLGASSWTSGACVTPLLLNGSLLDTCIRQITNATNASPIVCTTDSAHGWSNGDVVVIVANGSNGNTAAIGTFKLTGASGSTFSLQSIDDNTPLNTTGNGTWSGTAGVINLTRIATFADVDGGKVGGQTDKSLSNCTILSNGIVDSDDPASWTDFTGSISAFLIALGATPGTAGNIPIIFQDGKTCVRVAATASTSATSIAVYPLEGPIASGTAIVFTNGVTATLTADAAIYATTLTVSALSGSIPVGHNGDAAVTGSGLPATITSGTLSLSFSSGTNRIARL